MRRSGCTTTWLALSIAVKRCASFPLMKLQKNEERCWEHSVDAFYLLYSWPKGMRVIFWKKETLRHRANGNGCSPYSLRPSPLTKQRNGQDNWILSLPTLVRRDTVGSILTANTTRCCIQKDFKLKMVLKAKHYNKNRSVSITCFTI